MNKDIIGLVCWELYRKNIDNVVKKYRSEFEFDGIGISYGASGWRLNWRGELMYTDFCKNIYDFRTMKRRGVLPKIMCN